MAICKYMEKFSFTNRENLNSYFNNLSQNNPILFHFLINERRMFDEKIISAFRVACENYKINVFQPPSLVDMQVELTIGLEKEKVSFNLSSIHCKVDDLWEASGFRSNKSIQLQANINVNDSVLKNTTSYSPYTEEDSKYSQIEEHKEIKNNSIPKKEENDSDTKGCLIFAFIPFGLVAIKLIFALIMGENIYEMETDGENDIEYLRFTFGFFLVAFAIYSYNKWYRKK